MDLTDPSTGEVVAGPALATWDQASARIDESARAFSAWRATELTERARLLRAAATGLRRRTAEYAALMAREMGKPVAQGRAEIEKCALVCEHYAEHGPAMLARRPVATDAKQSWVAFQPLGVILAVMPWNFPFWQLFRFAAPSLLAGNTAVLKHASNVPGSALAIEACLREAGFPAGVLATVLADSDLVSRMIAHPAIAGVTLTGSVAAGRAVARAAGEHLKKTVLELGGSDAYVILADADVPAAAALCARSRLINAGQSCIAAKRFIVDRSIAPAFERALVDRMGAAVVGDPHDERTEIGPLARVDLRDELHRQVEESVARGARLLLGGQVPARAGAWYPATVLADVRPGMPAHDDELFGPVAAVITADGEEDALRIANDSRFGLGAAILTRDTARGAMLAETRLEAGNCFVNAFVRSDPRLPFGGVRDSGYGRELGELGILEFVNAKTVWVGD
ncbi:MAG TPA: NAD-dependent succinate-semialdehyde dehydrogenase [Kofleriaceae bacterium]|nr:NAD-dependent succinate-semialdehyde dehydrogenase [Kofleriaceae bacterium]